MQFQQQNQLNLKKENKQQIQQKLQKQVPVNDTSVLTLENYKKSKRLNIRKAKKIWCK